LQNPISTGKKKKLGAVADTCHPSNEGKLKIVRLWSTPACWPGQKVKQYFQNNQNNKQQQKPNRAGAMQNPQFKFNFLP
jgi:hypothetical protein